MKSHSPATKPSTPARSSTARSGAFFRSSESSAKNQTPFFQTSLEVSQPGDKHEVEADAMADHVVNSQDSAQENSFFSPSSGVQRQPEISRVAFESQREDSLQRKEEEEEAQEKTSDSATIQRSPTAGRPSPPGNSFSTSRVHRAPKTSSSHSTSTSSRIFRRARPGSHLTGNHRINPSRARGPPQVSSEFEKTLRSTKGGGQPMSDRTRGKMESSFNADFSSVRIHTDSKAQGMSRDVNAKAFAHGQDIYFSPNRYQPDDRSGKHLLAHELTHVVQQGHAVQRSPNSLSRAPPQIQRIPTSMEEVREEINDLADNIPGYTLGTVLIGYNPILGRNVDWSASAFFRGAAGLLPGGTKLYDKLNEGGALDSAFEWIEKRIDHHDLTWSRVKKLWSKAWDRMGLSGGIYGNLEIFKNTFSGFFSDIGSFIDDCIAKLTEILTALAVKAVRALFGDNGPAYDMMTMVLGKDPITDEPREWVTIDFLRASMDFFGFENHRKKMEETGKLQEAADWLDTQFGILSGAIGGLIDGVKAIWDTFSLSSLADPLSLLERIVTVVVSFIAKMLLFVENVAKKVLELIKAALVALLKPHLNGIPGYPLLRVALGKDPITGEVVPRNADNFIMGFLSFVPGGMERYKNLKKSGAIDKALNWLLTTVNELGLSPAAIAKTFLDLWNSFSIDDLMNPIPAFVRIGETLLTFVTNVLTLVAKVALKILEFVFIGVMGPAGARVVAALKQGKSTFNKIIKDPVGFLGNLLTAVGKGFGKFGTNIWKHLKAGLVGWLFGALSGAGLQLPEKFDLKGILSLVAQVLGLTYDKIRPKLVKRLGEKAVVGLEKSFEFVTLFLKEGFAGVWKKFVEYIGNLKDTFMGAIKEWIVTKIVTIAIQKLATMSNPVGAVIEAIIAIYNVVMFFIERMEQILAVVESIIQSITKIADGKLEDAANFVEKTLARTLPVIISFLARLIGLGGIAAKIKKVITKIQKKIEMAVQKVLDWIVKKFKKKRVTNDADISDQDRKKNKQTIDAIIKKLNEPTKNKKAPFSAFYTEKTKVAKQLIKEKSPKIKKGLKLTITYGDLRTEEKDQDVDFKIKIAPNTNEGATAPAHQSESYRLSKNDFTVEQISTGGGLSGANVIIQNPKQGGDRFGIAAVLALTALRGSNVPDVSVLLVSPETPSAINKEKVLYENTLKNVQDPKNPRDLSKAVGVLVVKDAGTKEKHAQMASNISLEISKEPGASFAKSGPDQNGKTLVGGPLIQNGTPKHVGTGTELMKKAVDDHTWEVVLEQVRKGFKVTDLENQEALIQKYLESKGIQEGGKYLLMWIRKSGPSTGTPFHDTSGILINLAIKMGPTQGRKTVLIGDSKPKGVIPAASEAINMIQYWKSLPKELEMAKAGFNGQLAILQWIAKKTQSLAMGMRSGVLEANALTGIPVIYFEEMALVRGSARMEQWLKVIPTFHRILLQTPIGKKQRQLFLDRAETSKTLLHFDVVEGWETDVAAELKKRALSDARIAYGKAAVRKEIKKLRAKAILQVSKTIDQLGGPTLTEEERAVIGHTIGLEPSKLAVLQEDLLADFTEVSRSKVDAMLVVEKPLLFNRAFATDTNFGADNEGEKGAQAKSFSPRSTPLERQADTMADRVVQNRDSHTLDLPISTTSRGTRAKMSSENEPEAGKSLPSPTKTRMETSIGSDFNQVRIHDGPHAQSLSNQFNARAFTVGHDIYFNRGEYSPNTKGGQHLLAHELTHVVQQSGGRAPSSIQRVPNEGQAPDQQAPLTSPDTFEGTQGRLSRVGGLRMDLPTLQVPDFKGPPMTPGRNLVIRRGRPEGVARETQQRQLWDTTARGGAGLRTKLREKLDQAHPFGSESNPVYYLRIGRSRADASSFLIGTETNIRNRLLRPYWLPNGRTMLFEVDHKREYQLNGPDTLANLWLLERKANGSSGRNIDGYIERNVNALLNASRGTAFWRGQDPPGFREAKRSFNEIRFNTVEATLPYQKERGGPHTYSMNQIKEEATQLDSIHPLSLTAVRRAGLVGSPTNLVIFNNRTGGRRFNLNLPNAEASEVPFTDETFLPGFKPTTAVLSPAETTIVRIRGRLWSDNAVLDSQRPEEEIEINRFEGLEHTGVLNVSRLRSKIQTILNGGGVSLKGMSPIQLSSFDLLGNGAMNIRGKVLTDIPLISQADIDIAILGNDVRLEKTFNIEDIRSPSPLNVTHCSITAAVGTESGLSLSGEAGLEIPGVARGSIGAEARTGVRRGEAGFRLNGNLEFDTDLFSQASIEMSYEATGGQENFSVSGTLGIEEGKVNGINSADVTVTYDNGNLTAEGNAQLDIPGVESVALNLSLPKAGGFTIGGTANLSSDIPGIESGSVTVSVTKPADAENYEVSASGTAVPSIPGVSTQLTFAYENGAVTIGGRAEYVRDLLSGSIELGATNRPIGDDGNPTDGEPTDTFSFYGAGSLTIRITPWLEGTIGVRFFPNAEIEVSGEIGLANAIDVFSRIEVPERELIGMGFDIPIFAIPVGPRSIGLKATIAGGLRAFAGIGPGQLRNLSLGVTYNPDHVDQTRITGNGRFVIPADAGLKLAVSASIGLDVLIGGVEGGIELAGGLGLEAEAGADVNVNWTPASGLTLNASLFASVQPQLLFSIDGFIRAWIAWYEKEWRWNLADYRYGPDLRFGIRLPITYREGESFNPSFDDIELTYPQLNAQSFLRGLIRDIRSSRN